MILYAQENDAHRWSFNPFHDLYPSSSYCPGSSIEHASFCCSFYPNGATDEHRCEENMRMPMFQNVWSEPSVLNYYSGYDNGCRVEAEYTEPSNSCSSPGDSSCGDDWSIELADDYSEIVGEVGKRINLMLPIPHVPRVNGDIPSVDEAVSDHQRLIDRLHLFDLVELKVQGDGNCQFRALSDQFYCTPEHHKFVRQQVLHQLRRNSEIYEGYVPMTYHDYLEKLSQDGEWGDHVTLQAAADSYGVKILVMTSFKDTYYIEILPKERKSTRVIYLSFWAEVHYNSIYPEGDLPASETRKKRRQRRLRNRQ